MKNFRYWVPVVVWMSVIFYFSSRTRVQISTDSTLNFLFFKSLHIGEYMVLYLLNFRAVKNMYTKFTRSNTYVVPFVITILYAISDEFHQLFVPTREGRLRDVIIDAFGAGISWLIINYLLPKMPKKLQILGKKLEIL